jgi:hypothetical protein
MKTPVNIDALAEEWAKDSTMDLTEPSKELSRIPVLHAKYLRVLSHHKLMTEKHALDYQKMKKVKWEYYSGDLNNPDDLKEYNLQPILKKILRQDIPLYLDSDDDLNRILAKKILNKEIVDFCDRILRELHNRTFQLGNIVKWEQFIHGQ